MTIDRAIEILDPEHREHYDGMGEVNEACRMVWRRWSGQNGLRALRRRGLLRRAGGVLSAMRQGLQRSVRMDRGGRQWLINR